MNLKKSDKMIAIVGVAILIIAAVGIVLYTAYEEPVEDVKPTEETFMVTWNENSGQLACISGFAGKSAYTDPFAFSVPSGSVLTSVSVRIVWKDDNTYRGVLSKGVDSLTAEIGVSGGESQLYKSTTGSGNETLYFVAYDRPYDETLDAKDYDEAQQMVYDMVQGKNDASYDVKVTVKTGEKLRRPLQYLKDKGNSFELFVSYTYYTPMIEQDLSSKLMNDIINDDMQGTSRADLFKTIDRGRDVI